MSKTALIIGANRGLGLGLVQRLREDGWNVVASVREPTKADALRAVAGVEIEQLDMNDLGQLQQLGARLASRRFDLVFVNAGVKGPDNQSVEHVSADEVGALFFTNAVAPIRVARQFAAQVPASSGVIAFMSSVLGSITIPDAPELALYKASKAALNSMVSTFATTLGQQAPTVLSLHPGWVKTDMGGDAAPLDVHTSTRGLVDQINALSGRGGHHFVDYAGDTLAW